MKRLSLAIFLLIALISERADTVFAQSMDAGLPWSVTEAMNGTVIHDIPIIYSGRPDYEKAMKEDLVDNGGAYRFGLMQDVDINLESPHKLIYLSEGRIIWTTKVNVEDALVTELFFSSFYLPDGVSMYLKNEKGNQIIGELNSNFTPERGKPYSTTYVQGSTVTIELNIQPHVEISDIELDINGIVAHYRGGVAENLNIAYGDEYKVNDALNADDIIQPTAAHPCHVNAICDDWSTIYSDISKTVAHINMGGSVCSGNLINNTSADCKPLFLTASHCDGTNRTNDDAFRTWRFYFNYEFPRCTGSAPGSAPMNQFITGAKFRARSYYEAFNSQIVGDFLLLELNDFGNRLGNQFDAYLAGWDRSEDAPGGTKFIGFHHPSGDPKKVVVFSRMRGNGNFNGGENGSHWRLEVQDVGGTSGGSSGSGIFAMSSRRLFGDLSGGPTLSKPCDDDFVKNYSVYSKLDRNWLYESGGDNTAATRLMDWLDPANTDAMTTETVKMPKDGEVCPTKGTSIDGRNNLNSAISTYPNPSTGKVFVRYNLSASSDLTIKVLNVLGKVVDTFIIKSAINGEVSVDLTEYPNGIYLFNLESESGFATKKVVLNK